MSPGIPRLVKELLSADEFKAVPAVRGQLERYQRVRDHYDDTAKVSNHGRVLGATDHMQHVSHMPLRAVFILEHFWPEAMTDMRAHATLLRECPWFRAGYTETRRGAL